MEKIAYALVSGNTYFTAAVFALLMVKSYLFFANRNATWRFADFLYFKYEHIQQSNSRRSFGAKHLQNFLSKLAFSFLLLKVVAVLGKWVFIDCLG